MKEEVPNNLITLFQNVKQTPEQGTTVYSLSTAKQIVSSTLFLLLP